MNKKTLYIPLILVTSLFFLWGFAYGLLDVLNKHFQETLNITKSRSALLQVAYFGAYFLISLPAALFMNKYGYKKAIILGLFLYATGSFLFYPAAQLLSFDFFVIALFILASGLTCLETAANPYMTVLGSPESSVTRLNLAQCFNGLGSFLGPLVAASLFFGTGDSNLSGVKIVYVIIGTIVLLIACLFLKTPLPQNKNVKSTSTTPIDEKSLFKHSNFVAGTITQFFYIAAQVGIAAYFINYCDESNIGISNATAAHLLSIALLIFTIGRFVGTALMRYIKAPVLLTVYACCNILLCGLAISGSGWISIYGLMSIFFFESIMFPTIFALSLKGLGNKTQKASSALIMSVVGGAIMPYLMGLLSELYSTAIAYTIPFFCFFIVAWFGLYGYKIKSSATAVSKTNLITDHI